MEFGLQKVRWNDETLTADVLDDKDEVVRSIQYTAREYGVCKAMYIQKGGEDYAQQEQGRGR